MTVREGDTTIRVPALQAVLRSQMALAAKGNGPAQRALIKMVQEVESTRLSQSNASDAHETPAEEDARPRTDLERARAIAYLLNKIALGNASLGGSD